MQLRLDVSTPGSGSSALKIGPGVVHGSVDVITTGSVHMSNVTADSCRIMVVDPNMPREVTEALTQFRSKRF